MPQQNVLCARVGRRISSRFSLSALLHRRSGIDRVSLGRMSPLMGLSGALLKVDYSEGTWNKEGSCSVMGNLAAL